MTIKILILLAVISPLTFADEEAIVSHRAYIMPTAEFGGYSQMYGVTFGRNFTRQKGPHERGVFTPWLKVDGIVHDQKLEAGYVSTGFGMGMSSCVPGSFEVGLGTAWSSAYQSVGVLNAGFFIGSSEMFQVGVESYTPLATNNKPEWYPDWTILFRVPIGVGKTHQKKIVETPM